MRLPVVFFTEGGGGRPGDTDIPLVSALDVGSFALWGALEGVVPRIAVVSGRCFAGNAVLAGCADLRIATPDANLGMAGPAMIAGGGLGRRSRPRRSARSTSRPPTACSTSSSQDEAEAVEVARRLLGYLGGATAGRAPQPTRPTCATLLPDNDREAFDVRPVVEAPGRRRQRDRGCASRGRPSWSPRWRASRACPSACSPTSRPTWPGAITGDAADKAADFLELCERWRLPVVSLVDTPGFMVGPEAERGRPGPARLPDGDGRRAG